MKLKFKYFENELCFKSISLIKVAVSLLVIVACIENLNAQQVANPFSYQPPAYTLRWEQSNPDVETMFQEVSMNNISTSLPAGHDGLMVEFNFNLGITTITDSNTVASFYDLSIINTPVLSVFSKNYSMTIQRYNAETRTYYNYSLLDKLFGSSGSVIPGLWNIRIYFTSHFIFIRTQPTGVTNNNYMSSIVFGLDVTGKSNTMNEFLEKSSNAVIRIGKLGTPATNAPPYVSNMKIYSFSHGELRYELQTNFSGAE